MPVCDQVDHNLDALDVADQWKSLLPESVNSSLHIQKKKKNRQICQKKLREMFDFQLRTLSLTLPVFRNMNTYVLVFSFSDIFLF